MTRLESLRYHMMNWVKMPFLRPIFRELLIHNASGVSQAGLRLLYSQQECSNPIRKFGFRCFSEHDEDGILLFLISKLGAWGGTSVEIGCGDAKQCNTTNLIINHGFQGLLIDSDKKSVHDAKAFFSSHPETRLCRPSVICERVTPGNVNSVLSSFCWEKTIDLLSIDIDGADLWVWNALAVTSPTVVVVEFNAVWAPGESMSVPPSVRGPIFHPDLGMVYGGASLEAFRRIADRKGYVLLGVNRVETNAFFVRKDALDNWGQSVSVESCLNHPRTRHIQQSFQRFTQQGINFGEWISVE